MPGDYSGHESTYVFDSESATEMARLMTQDRILTKGMGGIFPEQFDLAPVQDILDIACGPGGWVLDIAHAYPQKRVVGIDISQQVIEYARTRARMQRLANISFRIMDVLKPLDFPDASFDLINARFLFGVLPRVTWPKLLKECMRISCAGGRIRLTECEMPLTTSPAFEQLSGKFTKALQVGGHSFSPDGRQIGITPMLPRLLRDAGYENIQTEGYIIDCSVGMEAHESCYQDFQVAFKLTEPLLLKLGLTTPEEFDDLYQHMLIEMGSDDFCAMWYLLSAWGEKP